jgi:hypothetical protein
MLAIIEQSVAISSRHFRLDLDDLAPSPEFSVAPAADEELPYLATITARHIPGLQGTYLAFEQVHRYSRSILAIRKRHELVGCFTALLLNHGGLEHLLGGGLSIAEPSQSHLVRPGETAAAIYVWAVCLPPIAVRATGNVMQWLRQPMYARADLYARPGTPKGKTFMIHAGFHPLAGPEAKSLWVYRRPTRAEYPGIGFIIAKDSTVTRRIK